MTEEHVTEPPGDILIVDDIPSNLRLLSEILTGEGHHVRAAISGPLALNSVKAKLPELIMLDVMMPEMDGFEVCRRLKTEANSRDIPVIFISALDEPVEKVRGFETGGVDYISKPFESSEVLARVRAHLALRRYQRLLTEQNTELASARDYLEERVKERTTELEREIEERIHAEEETIRLRDLLKSIVDSMPSIVICVDTDGRVMQWNRGAKEATGLSSDEVQGRMLVDAFPQLQNEIAKVDAAISSGKPQQAIKVAYEIDGERRFHDVTVYPLTATGIQGAVVRVDDVTHRVRIEEMMVQNEKMISVGGLAAGMAHEINNPLGGIIQGVQNIQRRVSPDLPANARAAEECQISLEAVVAYLEKRDIMNFLCGIREAGVRAGKIVANMLQFSRKSDAQFVLTDLPALIDDTLELAVTDYNPKKRYDFRQIEIVREFSPDLPLVQVVSTEIGQVILNLLTNGAHAMQENEADRKPRFILRTKRDGNVAQIEVEDNGPGMSEDVRKRIFEPFFTTKPVGTGTGLGLSVSYSIITQNHGGTMSVTSTPGEGTNFVIRLPLEQESATANEKAGGDSVQLCDHAADQQETVTSAPEQPT